MTEVYARHFIETPQDGVVAPHVRHALAEMLAGDVEVVDALSLFRGRDDYLYMPGDSHWNEAGQRIVAKEVARRLSRYDVNRGIQTKVVSGPASKDPGGWGRFTEAQKAIASRGNPKTSDYVQMLDGSAPPDDPDSPILLTGNSYAKGFREELIRETRCLPLTRSGGDWTTEMFAEFLREPELLDHCKVVVWVITGQHLSQFKQLPSLP
jgi:hypothetical protein